MLTKDVMYELYFNKGYVIAVRLDEFGAFVGDLIDKDYVSLDVGKKMYRRAKNYYECRNESIIYCIGKFYDNDMPTLLFREHVTYVHERYLILYSAQDTIENIKLRIVEQEQKMKDNNDAIKKHKAEIKKLNQKISDLTYENICDTYADISCNKEVLKKYGVD